MAAVATVAEKMDHHPEWSNVYKRVTVDLSTHDAGGITELDFKLAEIDGEDRRKTAMKKLLLMAFLRGAPFAYQSNLKAPRKVPVAKHPAPVAVKPAVPVPAKFRAGRQWTPRSRRRSARDRSRARSLLSATRAESSSRRLWHRALVPQREPMTLDTIFDIASLTKVVATTSAIAKLVEEGKIRLNEKVTEYIPEFQGGKSDITVRNLLTHFSGMRPDVDLEPAWTGYDTGIRLATMTVPMDLPNSRFIYSDINFVLLGEIVQRVSGKTLPEYVQAKIFEPLGMSDTMYQPPQSLLRRIAPTRSSKDRQLHFAALSTIPRRGIWAGLPDMPVCSRLRRICRSSPRCCSAWGSETAFASSAR